MKKVLVSSAVACAALLAAVKPAAAQEVLTGDTRLACEAVLCLASGKRPEECNPSLRRYFSISYRKFSDTLRARGNFLKLCPASSQTPEMANFVEAIVNGAGRCDPGSLNAALLYQYDWEGPTYISNRLPDYCAAYIGNAYTNFNSTGTAPRYVGVPERGGYWVEAKDYDQALAAYNARIAEEDRLAACQRRHRWGGSC